MPVGAGRTERRGRKAAGAAAICLALIALALTVDPKQLPRLLSREARSEPAAPVPVVLLVFDELPLVSLLDRTGEIDGDLYPNFAELAGTSTWYRNATAAAELTRAALPSMLTGRDPSELTPDLSGRIPGSIFALLDPTHDVSASRAFPTLCALDVCRPAGYPETGPELPLGAFGREGRGKSLLAFLERLEPSDEPCLCVMHLVMPHSPWRYLPGGQQYPGTDPMPGQIEVAGPGRKWVDNDWLVTLARARHLLQVGFVDRLLGLIVERLQDVDLYDEALVAVVADHGIAFQADEHKRAATPATIGEVGFVPLFVKFPDQERARTVDDPVSTLDVVPTIADVVDLAGSDPFDGISLLRTTPTRARRLGGENLSSGGTELEVALARRFADFPELGSWEETFGLAPAPARGWIGKPAPHAPIDPEVTASVTELPAIRSAAPDDLLAPALIEGELQGIAASGGDLILLAIDGTVVAATEAYRYGDGTSFYALVSPRVYADPPHRLQVFRLGLDGVVAKVALREG